MAFSTNDDGDVLSEINITPLVDVMLVLLVAFMVTAPLLTNAVRVNLPKTAPTAQYERLRNVIVTVDSQGGVYIDKTPVEPNALEGQLALLAGQSPDVALSLQGDEAVPYGAVARAMTAIERSGIKHVSVLTTVAH